MQRRYGRYPQVVIPAADRNADAAVLWQTAFGDIQLRHDLDARDDGGPQPRRRCGAIPHHAVDTIADGKAVVERLDMNIRRPALDSPRDQHIDEADHRRLA